MEAIEIALKILIKTYKKNLEVLNSQNEIKLEEQSKFTKLYQSYWLSNERIKNAIEVLECLKSNQPL